MKRRVEEEGPNVRVVTETPLSPEQAALIKALTGHEVVNVIGQEEEQTHNVTTPPVSDEEGKQ